MSKISSVSVSPYPSFLSPPSTPSFPSPGNTFNGYSPLFPAFNSNGQTNTPLLVVSAPIAKRNPNGLCYSDPQSASTQKKLISPRPVKVVPAFLNSPKEKAGKEIQQIFSVLNFHKEKSFNLEREVSIERVELSSSPSSQDNNELLTTQPPSRARNPMELNFTEQNYEYKRIPEIELHIFSPSPPPIDNLKKTKRNRSISCPVNIDTLAHPIRAY